MCGMFTSIIARRRPIGSDSQPDSALPIGWLMYATLPYQVACSALKYSVSSGLRSACRPRSTGMTIVGKAIAMPRSTSSKFLAELARICGNMVRNLLASGWPTAAGAGAPAPSVVSGAPIAAGDVDESVTEYVDFLHMYGVYFVPA